MMDVRGLYSNTERNLKQLKYLNNCKSGELAPGEFVWYSLSRGSHGYKCKFTKKSHSTKEDLNECSKIPE